jgi:mitochondrial distribution and morphology protein 12
MSIRLFWNKLNAEENVAKLQQFLTQYFDTKIEKPDYIGNIQVTHLRLGTKEPLVSILDVADVFEEFYSDELTEQPGSNDQEFEVMCSRLDAFKKFNNNGNFYNPFQSFIRRKQQTSREQKVPSRYPSSSPIELHLLSSKSENSIISKSSSTINTDGTILTMDTSYSKHPLDFQVLIHIDYESDIEISIETELLINYPVASFMSLPVRLIVKDLTFQGDVLVSVTEGEVNFCIYEPEKNITSKEKDFSEFDDLGDETSPLKGLLIESEIGDGQKQVLKNVDKIAHFVKHHLHKILRETCTFPKCLTIRRTTT